MASIYDLKPAFQGLLRPMVATLAAKGVTANQVTIGATLLSAVVGGLIAAYPQQRWPLLLVPLALFVRMALNAIDGMLAREFKMQSALGGFLNELGDVFSDSFLYLPFALIPGIPPLWIIAIVLLAVISEMTGVVAVQIGAERRYDGPMGKSDRAFVFGALALALGLGLPLGPWISWLLAMLVFLLMMTIGNRMRRALALVS